MLFRSGCSTGLFPKLLKDSGYQAQGIELNATSARWGREHFGLPIAEGSIDQLLEGGPCFDLISMTDVLEHTEHPPHEVAKVRQLLRPGGYFLVTFPDIASPSSRYLYLLSKLTGREWIWNTCHIPLHVWEFTYATAMRLFTENGFSLVDFQRCQDFAFEATLPGLLASPSNLAAIPGVSRWAGNQMEFLLRRTD